MANTELAGNYRDISLRTLDEGIRNWFDRVLSAHVPTASGEMKKVKVIFASGERWATAKQKKGIRDDNGVLILPIITIRRTALEPSPRMAAPAVEDQNFVITKRIDPKTNLIKNNAAVRDLVASRSSKDAAVYEVTTIPFPDFSVMSYEIMIQTSYMSHMNIIVEKLFHLLDLQKTFTVDLDDMGRDPAANGLNFDDRKGPSGFYFVAFMDPTVNIRDNIEEFTDQERIIRYTFGIKVPTYTLTDPEGTKASIQKEYTSFELKFRDEVVHQPLDPYEIELVFSQKQRG